MVFSKTIRKVGRFLYALSLAFSIALPFPSFAIKIPSASQMAAELENRYHINTGSIQNMGEGFNVNANKPTYPQVSLFFSPTDPKPGEKLTARAYTTFFSNQAGDLYFTWYLKRKGCDKGSAPTAKCDSDGSGNVTLNDWKVAAAQIMAQNGYENTGVAYNGNVDPDSDGYDAKMGGNSQVKKPDWCYVYEPTSGKSYEMSTFSGVFTCGNNRRPACVSQDAKVDPDPAACNPFTGVCAGGSFLDGVADSWNIVGSPSCSIGNAVSCVRGTMACLPDDSGPFTTAQVNAAASQFGNVGCVYTAGAAKCDHLFAIPQGPAAGEESGDGDFNDNEEKFWKTDPADPGTANNGNKDEANVVGLGQDSFTWNYDSGDQIGLVVEGTSVIPTKHDDSSSMIMWAFSKNRCSIPGTSSYTMNIKGYPVTIPTTDMNLNDCLEGNLVDPVEGGQAKNLEVSVSVTPDNPINDETAEQGGDTLTVNASVDNSAHSLSETMYEWKIDASDSSSGGVWQDITASLLSAGLMASSKGNGLSSLPIQLNMNVGFLAALAPSLAATDPIYLRATVKVSENFSSAASRSGKSDVIVKVSNTKDKILAYTTTAAFDAVKNGYKVATDNLICNSFVTPSEKLDKTACRIVKNEIVGLKVNQVDPLGLTNFQWSINGTPLTCSKENVSNQCLAGGVQGEYAFFAVTGNVGETYTIRMDAADVASGKTVSLSRMFQIVDPEIKIVSTNAATLWPKFLGQYVSLTPNPITGSTTYDDLSENEFELYDDPVGTLHFKMVTIPSFVAASTTREWRVDGEIVSESAPYEIDYTPVTPKDAGGVYAVSLAATSVESGDTRRALVDIWGLTDFQSGEIRFSGSVQANVVSADELGEASGKKNFFAAVSQYIPSSVALSFRLMLTIALLIFTMSFVFALIPESSGEEERVILTKRD